MNILLHTCCAPCLIYPLDYFRKANMAVTAYFHNPNIHPYREFRRRLTALEEFSVNEDLPLLVERDYGLREFLRQVVFHEDDRCSLCYRMRLQHTAACAKSHDFEGFSTTLLYSRYQQHEAISAFGIQLAAEYGIRFVYHDFREGWQEGIDRSIQLGMYRQSYCGCIYSEQDRYDTRRRKRLARQQDQPTK